jgi:hypothetical protein
MAREEPRTLSLEINHRMVSFPEGVTVHRAAELNDIYIPSLCSHKDLSPFGGCRLCMVEIEGMRGYPLSCNTLAQEGMKVLTDTARVRELRQEILKLILPRAAAVVFTRSDSPRAAAPGGLFERGNLGVALDAALRFLVHHLAGFRSQGGKRDASVLVENADSLDALLPPDRLHDAVGLVAPVLQHVVVSAALDGVAEQGRAADHLIGEMSALHLQSHHGQGGGDGQGGQRDHRGQLDAQPVRPSHTEIGRG